MENKNKIMEIESFGLMLRYDSVEKARAIIEGVLVKAGNEIDFDYRRFQFIAARLMWTVRVLEFDYIDNVLIAMRKAMKKYFDQWGIRIKIKYIEKG